MSLIRYVRDSFKEPDNYVFRPTDARLGRHQVHDPRSRLYDVRRVVKTTATPTAPVLHERHAPIWDQGQIGSCTANAALGMMMTGPFWNGKTVYAEPDALKFYEYETTIDDSVIPGHYPPTDTGSTGLYSMKALMARNLIKGYRHAFTATDFYKTLATQPVSVGIPWFNSMFDTSPSGVVKLDRTSQIAGGHQICFDGIDPTRKQVRFANSWGTSWGENGWGWMNYTDFEYLLRQGGDAVTASLT